MEIAKRVVQQYGRKVQDTINIIICIRHYDKFNRLSLEIIREAIGFDNSHTLKLKMHDLMYDVLSNLEEDVKRDYFNIENPDLGNYRLGSYLCDKKTFMMDSELIDRLSTYSKAVYITYG